MPRTSTSSRPRRGSKGNPCPARTVRRVRGGRSTCSRKGVCPSHQERDPRRGKNRNPSGCRMKKKGSTGARRRGGGRGGGRGSTGSRKTKRCKPGYKTNGRGGCTHNPRSVHWQNATTASEAAFLSQVVPMAMRPPVPPANLPPASLSQAMPVPPASLSQAMPVPPASLPSAGLPSDGLRSAGLPSDGLRSAGLPSDGLRSAGLPSEDLPSSGLPSADLPSAAVQAPEAEPVPPALIAPSPVVERESAPAPAAVSPASDVPTTPEALAAVRDLEGITTGHPHVTVIRNDVNPRLVFLERYLSGTTSPAPSVVRLTLRVLAPLGAWEKALRRQSMLSGDIRVYEEFQGLLDRIEELVNKPTPPDPNNALGELVNAPVASVAEVKGEVLVRLAYLGAYAQSERPDAEALGRYSGMVDTLLPKLDALKERTAADDGTIRKAIVSAQSLVEIAKRRLADGDSSPLSNPIEPPAPTGPPADYVPPKDVHKLAYTEDDDSLFPPVADKFARCFYTRAGRDDEPSTFGEKDTRVKSYFRDMEKALPGTGANALMAEVGHNPWGYCRQNGLRMIDGELSFDGMHDLRNVAHRMAERLYRGRGNLHGAGVFLGRMLGRGAFSVPQTLVPRDAEVVAELTQFFADNAQEHAEFQDASFRDLVSVHYALAATNTMMLDVKTLAGGRAPVKGFYEAGAGWHELSDKLMSAPDAEVLAYARTLQSISHDSPTRFVGEDAQVQTPVHARAVLLEFYMGLGRYGMPQRRDHGRTARLPVGKSDVQDERFAAMIMGEAPNHASGVFNSEVLTPMGLDGVVNPFEFMATPKGGAVLPRVPEWLAWTAHDTELTANCIKAMVGDRSMASGAAASVYRECARAVRHYERGDDFPYMLGDDNARTAQKWACVIRFMRETGADGAHGDLMLLHRALGAPRKKSKKGGKKGVSAGTLASAAVFLTDLRAYAPELDGVYREPQTKKEAYATLMEFAAGLGPQ